MTSSLPLSISLRAAQSLGAVDQEPEVEQVIEDLAHEWEGRIDVQLLGPMAACDFAGTAQPES
jgi:hypothetical protein